MQNYTIQELSEAELGKSNLNNKIVLYLTLGLGFLWTLFQLWTASPLQYLMSSYWKIDIVLNSYSVRVIHLLFALVLAFLTYPAFRNISSKAIAVSDYLFAFLACICTLYLQVFYRKISNNIGIPDTLDVCFAFIGIMLLIEGARRTVGNAIALICLISLLFCAFGESIPALIAHKNFSLATILSHQWISSGGVFGIPIGVSADFVFLYVFFGVLLDKAGGGDFFIKISFALLGRFTGGPAKAAVVASGLMGMISGSSIANTLTVGSFTIPLMKKMGLSGEKAAAIEVSAGINGQIMPPVMGAAAFLMAEFLSIPYIEVVKYAFFPAILVYIALLYIVHIEAVKLNQKPHVIKNNKVLYSIIRAGISLASILIIFTGMYLIIYGIKALGFVGLQALCGKYFILVAIISVVLIYFVLLAYQSRSAAFLSKDLDVQENIWRIFKNGLHYLLPLFVLIWCLMFERLSASLAAYWSSLLLMFILVTQRFFCAVLRKQDDKYRELRNGFYALGNAMVTASRNMVGIAIATAAAGIIIGTVSLTGIGLNISSIVDTLASGNIFFAFVLTALICMVLGIGMPTTACYIIVSTLMIPVLEYLTMKNALYIPKISMHLFVLYFGLMADVTPPVGLASYAAAAIARSNAVTTSVRAFLYNIRTMLLPFAFISNPVLLFYHTNIWSFILASISATVGMLIFVSATQRYLITKTNVLETLSLLVITMCLLFPNISMEIIYPTFTNSTLTSTVKHDKDIRLTVASVNNPVATPYKIVLHDCRENTVKQCLHSKNIDLLPGQRFVSSTRNELTKQLESNEEYRITAVETKRTPEIDNRILFVFGGILLFVIIFIQKRRVKKSSYA